MKGSGGSSSRRRVEALDVGDEVDDRGVPLSRVVGRAFLDDLAHLIRTRHQRLSASEDVGEYPAEGLDLVENGVVLEATQQRVAHRATHRGARSCELGVVVLDKAE